MPASRPDDNFRVAIMKGMERRGWGVPDLAEATGHHFTTWSRFLHGQRGINSSALAAGFRALDIRIRLPRPPRKLPKRLRSRTI